MTTQAEPLAAPLHPTVLDALRYAPAASLAGQPVTQVLATMGLPVVPQPLALPPLPGLPPMPALDMTGLLKPITDLFGGFGTGILGANGAVDPQALLQNVTQTLSAAVGLAEGGLQLLQSMQGAGTQAAAASGLTAQGTSVAVATQATQMKTTLGSAAATVATGAAEIAAVATRLIATETVMAPLAATPGGQAALLAAAAEAAAEAAAITARTKVRLLAHSGAMTQTGSPVAVRGGSIGNAGSGAESVLKQLISGAEEVQQVVQPLVPAASQVAREVTAAQGSGPTGFDSLVGMHGAAVVGAPAVTTAGGEIGGTSEPASMGAWQERDLTETAAAEPATTTAATMAEEPLPPMIPAAGALTAIRAGAADTSGRPETLVNARNGEDLVGRHDDDVPQPVIGAIATDSGGPDKPFSL